MSQIITVDGNARTYKESSDPNYTRQLGKPGFGLGKTMISAGTALTGDGDGYLTKIHKAAGKNAVHSAMTLKDVVYGAELTDPNVITTVVFGFYRGLRYDADTKARIRALLDGAYAALIADDYALLDSLMIGNTDID